MTDAVQIELIRGLTVGVPGLFGAVGGMVAAYFSYKASQHAKEAMTQVAKVEQNTNHLKDELVAEVRKASIEVGKQQEKAAASERDTNFQAGRQSQMEGNPTG
jgi:hypothetical protein